MTPLLIVLSSPSGGGKTTLAHQLIAARSDCAYSISATTRPPRGKEIAGVDYHFLTAAEFESRIAAGDFLEHAAYNGHQYGTLASELRRILADGKHVILDIEIVGAREVQRRFPEAVLIFVIPPSGAELLRRLRNRGTESDLQIQGRLERALTEIAAGSNYDYLVVNDALPEAVREVSTILDCELLRLNRAKERRSMLERVRAEVARELADLSGP